MPPDPPRQKVNTIVTFPQCKYCESIDAYRCRVCDEWTCNECVHLDNSVGGMSCLHGKDISGNYPRSDWKPVPENDFV